MKNILILTIAYFVFMAVGAFIIHDNYDYTKTAVKVSGSSGHGSGNVVDSSEKSSLILTNRHVCVGATQDIHTLRRIHNQMFYCRMTRNIECMKKLRKELKELLNPDKAIGQPMTIKFNNLPLKDIEGKIKTISKFADLCLVEIPKGRLPVIKIAQRRAKPGDRITALGNPLDMTNHMTDGRVGDEIEYMGNVYQHHTAPIYPGSSGSGTVNEDGELVGVNTLGGRAPTASYMISLLDIVLFLDGNLISRELVTKLRGI